MIAKYSLRDMEFYISLEESEGDLDVIKKKRTLSSDLFDLNERQIGKRFHLGVYDSQLTNLNLFMSPTGCNWEGIRDISVYVPSRVSRKLLSSNFDGLILTDEIYKVELEILRDR